MGNEIVTARKGPVLEITLNRPEIGNAASDAMAVELTKLLLGAADGSEIVVLRGAGSDFCVGRESMGKRAPGAPPEAFELRRRNDVVFNCYGAFRRCEIPVIGVVKGRALRLRLRHRRGVRHYAFGGYGKLSGPRDGAQHHADHGDVGARRSRPAQGDDLSGMVDRGDQPRAGARSRHCQRYFPGGRPRCRRRSAVRADHARSAAGASRLQGLCARRFGHGRRRRHRFARSIHAVINSSSEMLPPRKD